MLRHELGGTTYYSIYAHLQNGSVLVSNGSVVTSDAVIGKVNCTGYIESTGNGYCASNDRYGSHLHFVVKKTPILGCAYLDDSCSSDNSWSVIAIIRVCLHRKMYRD